MKALKTTLLILAFLAAFAGLGYIAEPVLQGFCDFFTAMAGAR